MLQYSTTTGLFSGYIITNQCPSSANANKYNGVSIGRSNTPSCINQTFPAPAYVRTPVAAPLRQRLGLAIRGGENIYNALDAGFTAGQACSVTYGTCDAGTDVYMCEKRLEYLCGTSRLTTTMFMDDCGGHAAPYHYHCHMKCENATSAGHSLLVGVLLDGRGLYGAFESAGSVRPTNLDACGGHFGPVPATTVGGVVYPAAANVYHYHVQDVAPFTAGCFGPVNNLTHAKSLYSTCSAAPVSYCTSAGLYANYTLDCPVFRHGNETMNQVTPTTACPACSGNCVGEYAAASTSPTRTPSAAQDVRPAAALAAFCASIVIALAVTSTAA